MARGVCKLSLRQRADRAEAAEKARDAAVEEARKLRRELRETREGLEEVSSIYNAWLAYFARYMADNEGGEAVVLGEAIHALIEASAGVEMTAEDTEDGRVYIIKPYFVGGDGKRVPLYAANGEEETHD